MGHGHGQAAFGQIKDVIHTKETFPLEPRKKNIIESFADERSKIFTLSRKDWNT